MSQPLHATGTVAIVMVMNLRRFIQAGSAKAGRRSTPSSAQLFEQLRGTDTYARFLKQLTPASWFAVDEHEQLVEQHGHDLRVFRQYLLDNYFFPTYRLRDSTLVLGNAAVEQHPTLARQLAPWIFKVRLTRNGLAVVKLERQLRDEPLIELTRLLLEIQDPPPDAATPEQPRMPTQWQLAMDVAARFVEACGLRFDIAARTGARAAQHTIHLTPHYDVKRLPLHDRHITYMFSQITCDGQPVSAATLVARHANDMAGLLESAMLLKSGGFEYPAYKAGYLAHMAEADTASWQDELCLITSDATLIYCPLVADATVTFTGSTRADSAEMYADYWKSIVRGVEHVVALKNEVQLLERDTTRLLETIPAMTEKAADGNLSRSDRREILGLATGVATLFKALPQQRDALVPSSVFRADYAARKLHYLMQILGIYELEQHIQTNVQELNEFLAHYNSVQLSQDSQRTNLVFSLLTAFFSVIAVPSLLADLVSLEVLTVAQAQAIWLPIIGSLVLLVAAFALVQRLRR